MTEASTIYAASYREFAAMMAPNANTSSPDSHAEANLLGIDLVLNKPISMARLRASGAYTTLAQTRPRALLNRAFSVV